MDSSGVRGFRKLCLATLVAVYFLIGVGGIVRTTGAGMGCPDWPRCFGSWVPPTSVDQLPANYKEINASFREKKNRKFAKYLAVIGLAGTADKIMNDKSILVESDFNVTKAWIEYGNRLVGVIIGFFILALFWKSIKLKAAHPKIFIFSLAALAAVILQAWFGSIVVSTNLTTWTVTLHMFLALLIVGVLIYLISYTEQPAQDIPPVFRWIVMACMISLLIQVFLGTQVREAMDAIAVRLTDRNQWIDALGLEFIIHRSFSILVLLLNVILALKLKKTLGPKALPVTLIILILCTLLTGAGMAYLAVPAVLQPLHLVLATGTFGVELFLLFRINSAHKVLATN